MGNNCCANVEKQTLSIGEITSERKRIQTQLKAIQEVTE